MFYDFIVHSGSSIDELKLIGGADTLDEARQIAKTELARWPDQIVTITDRHGGDHRVTPLGRPTGTTKPDTERAVRVNITLSPAALALIDAEAGNRSGLIEQMILDRYG